MKKTKIPIAVLIGGGSKLPAIFKASKKGKFGICLVVTHKTVSPGIKYALSKKTPAVQFKLPNYRNRLFGGKTSAKKHYMETLGWFISQYGPKLLVFAGWDLIMDKNFFKFFKAKFGNGYAAINLHPALIPMGKEKSEVTLPDGTKTDVIKGQQEQVLNEVLKRKLAYFGPTVHFMFAENYDAGEVITREFIKVNKNDTVWTLRKKLIPTEDKILINAINEVVERYLK